MVEEYQDPTTETGNSTGVGSTVTNKSAVTKIYPKASKRNGCWTIGS